MQLIKVSAEAEGCPSCTKPLRDEQGRAIRRIDVDFETRLVTLDVRSWERLKLGTWIALAISAVGAVPFLGPAAGLVIVVFNLVWARWALAAPYRRYMGGARRIVVRWISRIVALFLIGFHSSFAVPFLPILTGPLVFAGICALVWWYHRFHFVRERERLPILLFEKILLVVLVLAFLLVVGVAIFFAVATGELASMINLSGE